MYQNNNIYASKYSDYVQKDAFNRSNNMYQKAKTPYTTGVVAPNIYQTVNNTNDIEGIDNNIVSSLTGNKIDIKNFKHNNMQPFLRGNITQNTEKFTQKLDFNTGVDKLYMNKQEVESIFKPTAGYDNINGAKPYTDFYKERLETSKINNNILPFEKIYVGPGLNKGYSAKGSGGFQQSDSLNYARPKTLDDLRSKVNQKNTIYEIPFQAPAKGTEQRAVVSPYAKNKPEKIYKQTADNWFKTTGAVLKDADRPEQAIKNTYRPDMHIEYQGGATLENVQGLSLDDDYGKQNITVYDNERQETQTRTVVSNITSTVKAVISPLLDVLKFNVKEHMVDSARAGGNPKAQIPSKMTIINTDDQMKTTVKETLIHDSDTLNLTGNDKSYSALHDEAKTTVKETLIHDSQQLNIKTIKSSGYIKNDDKAKTTNKETLPIQDVVRNIGKGTYRVYVYDPDMVVKKTVKETTIKGTAELGFIGGIINGLIGGYTSTDIDLKNTNKQFTSDTEEYGVAKATYEHRPTSREAEDNAEIDGTREQMLIEAGHTPNAGNMNIPIDKTDINMKTNKLLTDSYAQRDSGNVGIIYQTSPTLDECSITKEQNMKNAFENRLDGNILQSLNNNEYNISINPILDIAK